MYNMSWRDFDDLAKKNNRFNTLLIAILIPLALFGGDLLIYLLQG